MQRGEHDDGRSVLVVVEDGDVELLAKPALDLEASGGSDVLQVDAAEDGAIAFTVATISSTSFVARQMGQASTPPNSLNSIALPSMTGRAASGPMSPSPSTAVPSVTTATVCCLIVRFQTFVGSSAIADDTRATPGVYAIERSSRVFSGFFA